MVGHTSYLFLIQSFSSYK